MKVIFRLLLTQTNISISFFFPEPTLYRRKRKVVRERWTELQKQYALEYFSNNIISGKPLRKEETEKFKSIYSELFKNKTWVKIKAFIFNKQKEK